MSLLLKIDVRWHLMKRLLNCTASDFEKMNKNELLQAIEASEGRTMLAEVIVQASPLYPGLTNAEYVSAFGADLVLLNQFNVTSPHINDLPTVDSNQVITTMKKLIGRPVGINLEPVDENADNTETLEKLNEGRTATKSSIQKAKELGIDFICFTGNPKTGVTNEAIIQAIHYAKEIAEDQFFIIAGIMHSSGVKVGKGGILTPDVAGSFIDAGADIVLIPGVGTVPGSTLAKTEALVERIHEKGALALTTIGTSQEGADKETIQQMALYNKMAGADVHHCGDAGYHGISVPERIMDYSIAIRGKRHTYIRMATSINR